MKEEMRAMEKNCVWYTRRCQPGDQVIGYKWIFNIKNENTKDERYKARIVALDYQKKSGWSAEELYSPVAKMITIRILLVIANKLDLNVRHFDVKTAFLHGKLYVPILMEVPDGITTDKDLICVVENAIYGLEKAPHCWN